MDEGELDYGEFNPGLGFRIKEENTESRDLHDDDISSTVKQYLDICLQYHKSRIDGDAPSTNHLSNSFIHSCDDQYSTENFNQDKSNNAEEQGDIICGSNPSKTTIDNFPTLDGEQHEILQSAVSRAQSIARNFMSAHSASIIQPLHEKHSLLSLPSQGQANDYSFMRKQFLETFSKKLHACFIKNLEYLAKKDGERYMNHLQLIDQSKIDQEKVLSLLSQKQSIRQKFLSLSSVAGIGTKIRQKMESKKRKLHDVSTSVGSKNDGKKQINGLYIVGVPTTESFTPVNNIKKSSMPKQCVEEFIRQLFGSFGKIQRVTFYEDKKTGIRKGDALVVYDEIENTLDSMKDDGHGNLRSFLNDICSQVRYTMACFVDCSTPCSFHERFW